MTDLQKIEALIAAHRASWQALETACDVVDAAEPGSPEQGAAEEAQLKASDDTYEALWNVIEHPYSSFEELKRGMVYLAEHHRSTGDGDPAEWFKGFVEHLKGGAL